MSAPDNNNQPMLTIIICTYNRADLLATCLDSLTRQTVPTDQFSVLIVDNNSTDDHTEKVAETFKSKLPRIAYCKENQQGLSFARNHGLQTAETEWVAYLDDDATARVNWAERVFNMILHHPFDAFGGTYYPWYRDGKVPWYLDRYATDRTWMRYTEVTELHNRCFSGGNAVYRREAAILAGGFPINRGMRGKQLGYGEENTLQHELRHLGYRTGIDPDLNIDHLVPRYKQRVSWFLKRRCTEGKIHLWHANKKPTVIDILSLFAEFFVLDIRNLVRGIWRLLKRDYRLQNLFIDTVPELCFQVQVLLSLFSRSPPLAHEEATRANNSR